MERPIRIATIAGSPRPANNTRRVQKYKRPQDRRAGSEVDLRSLKPFVTSHSTPNSLLIHPMSLCSLELFGHGSPRTHRPWLMLLSRA